MTSEQLGLWGSPVKPREPKSPRTSLGSKRLPLDNLGPENKSAQLPMFMTPQEIHTHYQPTDGDRLRYSLGGEALRETHGEMMERKLDEAHHEGLTSSIKKHGVVDPIQLQASTQDWQVGSQGKYQIMDGNHRLAAANAINPQGLVPVEHHDIAAEAHAVGLGRRARRIQKAKEKQQAAGQQAGYAALMKRIQG